MKGTRRILMVLIFIGFYSQAYSEVYIFPRRKKTETKNEELSPEGQKVFFSAIKEKIIGSPETAKELLGQVLEEHPRHAPSLYLLAQIENTEERWNDAITHVQAAIDEAPENKWYKMLLGEIYRSIGQFDNAIHVYEQFIPEFPNNAEIYYDLAVMYLLVNNNDKAIVWLEKMEEKFGKNEQISLQKRDLYLHWGKKREAERELESLIAIEPDNIDYYNLLANTYVANEELDKAQRIYRIVAEKFPDDPYIHFNMADLYNKQNKRDSAFISLKEGFMNTQLSLEIKLQVLKNCYSAQEIYSDQKAQALVLGRILTEAHPQGSKAHAIYGEFLQQDGQYTEAKHAFESAIALNGIGFYLWVNYLNTLLSLNEFESISEQAKKALLLFPMQPVFFLYDGMANLELGNYSLALKQLERGEKLSEGESFLLERFGMYLGELHYKLKNYQLSDKYFEKVLALNPENSIVLNNYAYYLSLRNDKLDSAEKYAKKAVNVDPENINNQDTYGWVLFMQGRYEEAKYWIERAVKSSTTPGGVLLEHLGDIYYELGEVEKAVQFWKDAHQTGEASDQVEKKIENKKRVVN